MECAGAEFTAKGRTVKQPGWRALDAAYRAGLKNVEQDKETEDKALPELSEGQTLPLSGAAVKEGKTTPPKHFTDVIFCERKEWIRKYLPFFRLMKYNDSKKFFVMTLIQ